MSKLISIVFAVLIAVLSVPAPAQTQTPGLDNRIQIARDRVHDGFRRGDLTRGEADRLHRELDEALRMLRRAKSDGYASKGERRNVREELDRIERDIDRLMYNRARR